ncbi:MAG: hypothetical protein KF729_10010 [Sandaracinaceae bacterium]|nr:hypothetical protein [Sandaracinaceae bacterium]
MTAREAARSVSRSIRRCAERAKVRSWARLACALVLSILGCGGPEAADRAPRVVAADEAPSHPAQLADAPQATDPDLDDACVLDLPPSLTACVRRPGETQCAPTIASLEVPVTGAVARTCARIEREARARLPRDIPEAWRAREAQIADEEDGVLGDPPSARLRVFASAFGRCVGAGEGAWVVAVESASVDREAREQPLRVRGRLTYVGADGTTRAGEGLDYELDPLGERERGPGRVHPIHDYDGDGRVEASLSTHDTNGASTQALFTASVEGVRPVPLPEGVTIDGWIDADADGRPDIVTHAPLRVPECHVRDAWVPELIVHAGPGLGFSVDDEVARAHARRMCPCRPTRLLSRDDGPPLFSSQTLLRVACARLYATDAETIERRWHDETRALEGGGLFGDADDACAYTPSRLRELVHTPPPFTLAP